MAVVRADRIPPLKVKRESVIESCVRIHCPMSDGDGIEVRVEELQGEVSVSFWKVTVPVKDGCSGGFEEVEHEYISTSDDPVSAMEFLLAAARLINLSVKRYAK